jgi:hypothetical protein
VLATWPRTMRNLNGLSVPELHVRFTRARPSGSADQAFAPAESQRRRCSECGCSAEPVILHRFRRAQS